METDQAKHLDVLMSQSAKVLNKIRILKRLDSSTDSKWDNRSASPFDNQDTQTEKKDDDLDLMANDWK